MLHVGLDVVAVAAGAADAVRPALLDNLGFDRRVIQELPHHVNRGETVPIMFAKGMMHYILFSIFGIM